jgi:type IV secretory pathway ATPase VirB11/archaellum biosynthesis ATPase
MSMNTITVESVKREAKAIARATTISHSQALSVLAVQAGHAHWASYQTAIVEARRLAEERAERTIAPFDLLEALIGHSSRLPEHLRAARHLLISGTTSTGKTTLMRRLMQDVPKRVPVAVIERHPTMASPNPVPGLSFDPASLSDRRPAGWEAAHRAAAAAGAGMIVYDEVSVTNARVILSAVRDPHCPTIMTTIHAKDPAEAALLLQQRSDGIVERDHGIMCVQMRRDLMGSRVITDMVML